MKLQRFTLQLDLMGADAGTYDLPRSALENGSLVRQLAAHALAAGVDVHVHGARVLSREAVETDPDSTWWVVSHPGGSKFCPEPCEIRVWTSRGADAVVQWADERRAAGVATGLTVVTARPVGSEAAEYVRVSWRGGPGGNSETSTRPLAPGESIPSPADVDREHAEALAAAEERVRRLAAVQTTVEALILVARHAGDERLENELQGVLYPPPLDIANILRRPYRPGGAPEVERLHGVYSQALDVAQDEFAPTGPLSLAVSLLKRAQTAYAAVEEVLHG